MAGERKVGTCVVGDLAPAVCIRVGGPDLRFCAFPQE